VSLVKDIFDLISNDIPAICHYDVKTIMFNKINSKFDVNIIKCYKHKNEFAPKVSCLNSKVNYFQLLYIYK